MPVKVLSRGGQYRVVETASGRIAKTDNGRPRDGGGHEDKAKAQRQAAYINAAVMRKGGAA